MYQSRLAGAVKRRRYLYLLALPVLFFFFQNCEKFRALPNLTASSSLQTENPQNQNPPPDTHVIPEPEPDPGTIPPPPPPPTGGDPLCAVANNLNLKGWPNEDKSYSNFVDWGFDSIEGQGLMNIYPDPMQKGHFIMSCANAPVSPSNVLKDIRRIDGDGNGGIQLDYSATRFDEVYVAIVWAANSDFEGSGSYSNRLFIVQTDNANVFFMWRKGFVPSDDVLDEQMVVGIVADPSTLNNCHLSNDPSCEPGPSLLVGNVKPNFKAAKAQWHLGEIMLKKNSRSGAKDGRIRWWLDGELVGDYGNVDLGALPFSNITHQQGWVDRSILQEKQTKDWYYLIDHLRISGIRSQ